MSLFLTNLKTSDKGIIDKHFSSEKVTYNNGTYSYNLSNGGFYARLIDRIITTSYPVGGRVIARITNPGLLGESGLFTIVGTIEGFTGPPNTYPVDSSSSIIMAKQQRVNIYFWGPYGTTPGKLDGFSNVTTYNEPNMGPTGNYGFGITMVSSDVATITLYFDNYASNVNVIVSLEIYSGGFKNSSTVLTYSIQNSV